MAPERFSPYDALRHFADPALRQRLDELEPHSEQYTVGVTEHLHAEYHALHERIAQAMVARLQTGALRARGLAMEGGFSDGFVEIAADQWGRLTLDSMFGTVNAPNGDSLTNVQIWEVPSDAEGGETVLEPSASPVTWEDGVLTIAGEAFVVRGKKQAKAVDMLVEAHKLGRRIQVTTLMENAGSSSSSLSHLFTGADYWPRLQRHLHTERGRVVIRPASTSED